LASGIKCLADDMRQFLKVQIQAGDKNRKEISTDREKENKYTKLRSILHNKFNIPDHHDLQKVISSLDQKLDSSLFFFTLTHSTITNEKINVTTDPL
jgi:hypothetical protein